MFHSNWFDFHKLVICMFISLSHSLILIVDLNILNPKIQFIHSKLELDQTEKNLKKFCHKWPQVQNFTTKRKSATIEGKDIFGDLTQGKKKLKFRP
jgi:hypothetical protein